LGTHILKGWSNTQAVVALSSGEAEYYGMVKGASQGIGLRSVMEDLGVNLQVRVRTDASAAKGIASRRGLGKVRHIEVNQLWLQDKVSTGEVVVMKVKGEGNLADGLTKPLEGPAMRKHFGLTGEVVESGRHKLTPKFEAAQETEEGWSYDGSSLCNFQRPRELTKLERVTGNIYNIPELLPCDSSTTVSLQW